MNIIKVDSESLFMCRLSQYKAWQIKYLHLTTELYFLFHLDANKLWQRSYKYTKTVLL